MGCRPTIILASASPCRKRLLTEAGYKFTVVAPEVDESKFITEGLSPKECALQLALVKAKSIAEKFRDSLVIGADTVVDFNGLIIGKPADENEAEQIIRKLFGRPHKVITAVAILKADEAIETVQADTTMVYPKKMTAQQIAGYVKGASWRGKAGAYAIQETGDEFIEKIEGSLTNVMGLPMELLNSMLQKAVEKARYI